jgi:cysteine desulfurase family protein (TIGR01976 family)
MTVLQTLLPSLRAQFPSLARIDHHTGNPVIYLDGPAGSQVPQLVIDAISDYYLYHNANSAGMFATSRETVSMMEAAHQAAADWFGAAEPRECIFGANMTTMTMAFSRALSRTWSAGDRIVVTQLDHDANVTPWALAARDVGAELVQVKVDPRDATLDEDDFVAKLKNGAKLVAFTAASNSVGSTTRIAQLTELAHNAGAEVYVDAVHWAPHRLIEVAKWQVDYCICSAYKFFGPHVGLMWGRLAKLEQLPAYKLRPSPANCPGKWMTGTQNFAAISGVRAAIDYIASIGMRLQSSSKAVSRRLALQAAFEAIYNYEQQLLVRLVSGLAAIPGVKVFGITDTARFADRVPTVAFAVGGLTSQEVAIKLAARGIFSWHGNYYAVDICEAMGQSQAGMVRLGILHTNTATEIDHTLGEIQAIAAAR